MKYCLEFGIRGGSHTDSQVFASHKRAASIAAILVRIFRESSPPLTSSPVSCLESWTFDKQGRRKYWRSPTHFVALSKLDGIARGPASGFLWRKDEETTECFTTEGRA